MGSDNVTTRVKTGVIVQQAAVNNLDIHDELVIIHIHYPLTTETADTSLLRWRFIVIPDDTRVSVFLSRCLFMAVKWCGKHRDHRVNLHANIYSFISPKFLPTGLVLVDSNNNSSNNNNDCWTAWLNELGRSQLWRSDRDRHLVLALLGLDTAL